MKFQIALLFFWICGGGAAAGALLAAGSCAAVLCKCRKAFQTQRQMKEDPLFGGPDILSAVQQGPWQASLF